ncbi:MAG TPA: MBL fold metallo-hydrolase [Conexivisphaerales archaeon]|nr:MBL fold metallo-hydrolase [Conexivisphaerales archaeon]
MKIGDLSVEYLQHDCFRLEAGGTVLYTDPFHIKEQERKADYITISHDHFDHLSPQDLEKVLKPSTVIIASLCCRGKLEGLGREVHFLAPGETYRGGPVSVTAVAAYNTNKFRSPGHVFHEKSYNGAGFIIDLGGARIYHAGDTDFIEEMGSLGKVDVALLPVSGTYVMTADEAIGAARKISPAFAVPMHWGDIVGGRSEAEKFVRGVSTFGHAQLLEKER